MKGEKCVRFERILLYSVSIYMKTPRPYGASPRDVNKPIVVFASLASSLDKRGGFFIFIFLGT